MSDQLRKFSRRKGHRSKKTKNKNSIEKDLYAKKVKSIDCEDTKRAFL